MEAAKKLSAGAAGKRRHGSTALFVAVDYAFLLAFAGFLAYLVGSRILPSVASSPPSPPPPRSAPALRGSLLSLPPPVFRLDPM